MNIELLIEDELSSERYKEVFFLKDKARVKCAELLKRCKNPEALYKTIVHGAYIYVLQEERQAKAARSL